eukprot:gb/GECH01010917.1/.p1 GENE.gb/GECH01010917.1/~~gb/GECH01010917.1/.p1  ORF type:complete len:900 (+),score=181.57 gb/GECH01010917.1/:1-2700(+)
MTRNKKSLTLLRTLRSPVRNSTVLDKLNLVQESTPEGSQGIEELTARKAFKRQTAKEGLTKEIKYYQSCDLPLSFSVQIDSIDGLSTEAETITSILKDPTLPLNAEDTIALFGSSQHTDMYIECVLFSSGVPLCLPERTSHKFLSGPRFQWGEWISFPVTYSDLPPDAELRITIYDVFAPNKNTAIGGSSIPIFTDQGELKTGRQKVRVWKGIEAGDETPGDLDDDNEMARIERLAQQDYGKLPHSDWLDHLAFRKINELNKSYSKSEDNLFLNIQLPAFDEPVVFTEMDTSTNTVIIGPDDTLQTQWQINQRRRYAEQIFVVDDELDKINPSAQKHLKLSRGLRSHAQPFVDAANIKPDAMQRRQIAEILNFSPLEEQFSVQNKEMLWEFRYFLSHDKKALTKFLKCVDWNDPSETKEALKLLEQWEEIDVDDALELLSSYFSNAKEVRSYAVQILRKCQDEELLAFLLQLVQALRYEDKGEKSELAEFIMERACSSFEIANSFYWYLTVESEGTNEQAKMFSQIHKAFLYTLKAKKHEFLVQLSQQSRLKDVLVQVSKALGSSTKDRVKKQNLIRKAFAEKKLGKYNMPLDDIFAKPVPLSVDPTVRAKGIASDEINIFKSSMQPLGIPFITQDDSRYKVIFKQGDDMRQDQLVIQMINLMDKILKDNGLDLCLTPYKVVSTSIEGGFVQAVPNVVPMAKAISETNGDLRKFFENNAKNPGEMSMVIDNFVKSCAGYCVITYLLGVGDRHLDNLLLTKTGRLLHIDFGFILGRDPKPFPPPMKLCKEMVDGMGGTESNHYKAFKSYCCEAYNILRKKANLILNLFLLMVDANIPDIVGVNPSMDPKRNLLKVQERLRLDLDDDEAVQFMQAIIEESVRAVFAQITETFHRWAQYWRA